ncbi:MAG: hypothetical protein ACREBV_08840, partial [Candidatus Zixiibacteriota bacterium]
VSAFADEPLHNLTAEMDSLEKRLEWVNYRLALEQWEFDATGYSDSLGFYNDLYLYVISSSNIYEWAPKSTNVSDRTERQRLQILLAETLSDRIERRPILAVAKDSIKAVIDSFMVDFQGEEKSLAQVKGIYFNSRSRTQREQACRAWYAVGEALLPTVTKMIKERNAAAARLGFENYWEMVSLQFFQNGVDILQLVKTVDSLTQTANSVLFDEARLSLGVNQIELWDVPFVHSQFNEQANSFFPIDSQYIFARRGLASFGFDLDKLPIFIQEVSNQHSSLNTRSYSIKAPHDARVLTNLQVGQESMRELVYHIGIALHSTYIAQDRLLYNFVEDTTWQMAMGEIMAAMVNDSTWLNDVVNMPVGFISAFRKAQIEREVIQIRQQLVNISFVHEACINPDRDLNRLYWDIYQRYSGLPRHDDIIIWTTVPDLVSDPMNIAAK